MNQKSDFKSNINFSINYHNDETKVDKERGIIYSIEFISNKVGYKSLKPGFKWGDEKNPIPMFSVITGINGSGKTHLLELIKDIVTDNKAALNKLELLINNKQGNDIQNFLKELSKRYKYIDIHYESVALKEKEVNLKDYETAHQLLDELDRRDENLSTFQLFQIILSWTPVHEHEKIMTYLKNFPSNSKITSNEDLIKILEEADDVNSKYWYKNQIKAAFVEEKNNKFHYNQGRNLSKMHSTNYRNKYDAIPNAESTATLEGKHLPTIIYTSAIIEQKQSNDIIFIGEASYKKIQQTWNSWGFPHKIHLPQKDDKQYIFSFYKEDDDIRTPITLKDLSSGEKIILDLLVYNYLDYDDKLKLIIIDEFDAHLNPSIAQLYIKVLQEQFVSKDVHVIMTTHSPSTVAYVPAENLFWMEDGKILWRPEEKRHKQQILKDLTPGLVLLEDNIGLISSLFKTINVTYPENKILLLVEGDTDKIYISKAIKALKVKNLNYEKLEKVDIIPCDGANKIPTLWKVLNNTNHKIKKISLFDDDKEGRRAAIELQKEKNNVIKIKPVSDLINDIKNKLWNSDVEKFNYPVEYLFSETELIQYRIIEENENITKREIGILNSLSETESQFKWLFEKSLLQDKEKLKTAKQNLANNIEITESNFIGFKPTLDLILEIVRKREEDGKNSVIAKSGK